MNEKSLKKILIGSLGVVILLWSGVGIFYLVKKQGNKATLTSEEKMTESKKPKTGTAAAGVIEALEKKQEYCDLISENKNEFKLLCNGRPYLAFWENNQLKDELNGWSFLKKQPEILKEIQDNLCRLYQTTEDKNLTFVCEDEKVRKYNYTSPEFKLTKASEDLFLNEIFRNFWQKRALPCDLVKANKGKDMEEAILELTLSCQDQQVKIFFNFQKMVFSLPVAVGEGLTDEARIKKSVELVNLYFCKLDKIQKGTIKSWANFDCPFLGALSIDYDLRRNKANFLVSEENWPVFWPWIGRWLLPQLSGEKIEYRGTTEEKGNKLSYYSLGKQVMVALTPKEKGPIFEIYLKNEGF